MGNVSQILMYDRIREVYTYMNNVSKQSKEIIHYFSAKWTKDGHFVTQSDLSKARTIFNYIKKVKQTYYNFEKDVDIEKGRTLARLDELYQKLIKIQDYKGALAVLKEIGDIVGFKAPEKLDVKHGLSQETAKEVAELTKKFLSTDE